MNCPVSTATRGEFLTFDFIYKIKMPFYLTFIEILPFNLKICPNKMQVCFMSFHILSSLVGSIFDTSVSGEYHLYDGWSVVGFFKWTPLYIKVSVLKGKRFYLSRIDLGCLSKHKLSSMIKSEERIYGCSEAIGQTQAMRGEI